MTVAARAGVAGSWIDGTAVVTGGGNHQVVTPANGAVVAELALATPADVDTAVAAARRAQPGWGTATPVDRATGGFGAVLPQQAVQQASPHRCGSRGGTGARTAQVMLR
jgi:delta 1-pyrroline-5-carboxylate dehydrogenase